MKTARNCLTCSRKLDVEEISPKREEIYQNLTNVFVKCLSPEYGSQKEFRDSYGNVFPFCKSCRKAVARLHRKYSQFQIGLRKIQRVLETAAVQKILVLNRSTDYFTSVVKEEYTSEQLHCEGHVDDIEQLVGSEVKEENDEVEGYVHNGRIKDSIELNSNIEPGEHSASEPIISNDVGVPYDGNATKRSVSTHEWSDSSTSSVDDQEDDDDNYEVSSGSSDEELTNGSPVTSEDRSATDPDGVKKNCKPKDTKEAGTESSNQNVSRQGIQKHPLIRTDYRTFLYCEKFTIEIVDNGFQCCTCGYTRRERFLVLKHIRKVHTRPGRKNITMTEKSPNKWYYKEFFAEKFEDEYRCGTCDFACKQRENMRDHLRYRHYVKAHPECAPNTTFICEVCGAQTSSAFKLKEHKQCHDGELNFSCTNCDKRFNTQRHLRAHHKWMHAEEAKKFMCEYCGRKFCTQHQLRSHMFHHTGKREFNCKACGKSYASYMALQIHLNSHKGKKYSCDICGMEFTQSYSVTRHKGTAHRTNASSIEKS